MKRKEIGRFYAISFDYVVFVFIVYDDNSMSLPSLNIDSFRRIELKPRFVLSGKDFHYKYDKDLGLIANYSIDDDLFNYLKENRMISYSVDMAYLYGFNDKDGYDKRVGVGSPYKWANKKGPILVRQRRGEFN